MIHDIVTGLPVKVEPLRQCERCDGDIWAEDDNGTELCEACVSDMINRVPERDWDSEIKDRKIQRDLERMEREENES